MEVSQTVVELTIRWEDPTPCTHGGELTGYIFQYRSPSLTSSFTEEAVDQGSTVFMLSNLVPGTTYEIKVAARNSVGTGPFSDIMSATTAELGRLRTNITSCC